MVDTIIRKSRNLSGSKSGEKPPNKQGFLEVFKHVWNLVPVVLLLAEGLQDIDIHLYIVLIL